MPTMKKLVTFDQLNKVVRDLRKRGNKIAWTNGCFDIIHAGHIDYLEKASAYGDVLIVGLNSDQSVKKWKNSTRPIFTENYRALVLNAIVYIDYIIIFDKKSPISLIEKLKPDYFIKGGDYTIDTIDQKERRVIEDYGGEISIIPAVKGLSSSLIIERILAKSAKI